MHVFAACVSANKQTAAGFGANVAATGGYIAPQPLKPGKNASPSGAARRVISLCEHKQSNVFLILA